MDLRIPFSRVVIKKRNRMHAEITPEFLACLKDVLMRHIRFLRRALPASLAHRRLS